MGTVELVNNKKFISESFNRINNAFPYRSALAITIFSILTLIILVFVFSGVTIVPWAIYPPFGDMISITCAVECIRAGYDPYIFYGFDPWFRFFNYPKIWLALFNFFNLTKETANYIGIGLVYLYALATIFIFNPRRIIHLLLIIIIIISPPVLLLLERGNSDIIIYLLVLTAVYYFRKVKLINEKLRLHLTYLIILFAAILKLYPAFLLPLLFFERISRRDLWIILLYSSGILIVYFLITYNDILLISKNTPRPEDALSYGKNVGLNHFFKSGNIVLVSNTLLAFVLAAAFYVSRRFKGRLDEIIPVSNNTLDNIFLFLTGGLLYMGTFYIGNNYDYRLVFLILLIPFILEIINHSEKNKLFIAVAIIFISLFYGAFITHFVKIFEIFKILASWGLCFIIFLIAFHVLLNMHNYKHAGPSI